MIFLLYFLLLISRFIFCYIICYSNIFLSSLLFLLFLLAYQKIKWTSFYFYNNNKNRINLTSHVYYSNFSSVSRFRWMFINYYSWLQPHECKCLKVMDCVCVGSSLNLSFLFYWSKRFRGSLSYALLQWLNYQFFHFPHISTLIVLFGASQLISAEKKHTH